MNCAIRWMQSPSRPLAAFMAHLTKDQIDLCAWYYFDGLDQHDIATMLGITQQAVAKRIAAVLRILKERGIPMPKRMEHPQATRCVRNVYGSLANSSL